VFLSVLDVHVQRIPCDGRVERVSTGQASFCPPDLDKASEDNERNSMLLRDADGHQIARGADRRAAGPANRLPGQRGC